MKDEDISQKTLSFIKENKGFLISLSSRYGFNYKEVLGLIFDSVSKCYKKHDAEKEFKSYVFNTLKYRLRTEKIFLSNIIRQPFHIKKLKEKNFMKAMETQRVLSLDMKVSLEPYESIFLYDIIPSENNNPTTTHLKNTLGEKLSEMLTSELQEREMLVVSLKYGLNNREPKTYREIGKILGISRESVRKLCKKSLEKLRENINQLEEYRLLFRDYSK